jgi:hypothetical protein
VLPHSHDRPDVIGRDVGIIATERTVKNGAESLQKWCHENQNGDEGEGKKKTQTLTTEPLPSAWNGQVGSYMQNALAHNKSQLAALISKSAISTSNFMSALRLVAKQKI